MTGEIFGLTPGVQAWEEKSCLLLGVERVLDPVDLIAAVGLALDEQSVEACRLVGEVLVSREIEEGGFNDFALLGCWDRGCSAAKEQRFPELDLDKAERIAVAHEQINFTESATVIGL